MAIRELLSDIDFLDVVSVDKLNPEIFQVLKDLVETLEANNLDYITAPQIGVKKRIAVVNGTSQGFMVLMMINPTIVYSDENKTIIEYNDIAGEVQRVVLIDDLAITANKAIKSLGE